MKWMPEVRNHRWWTIAAISTIIVAAGFWSIRFAVLGDQFTITHASRFLLLSALLSFLLGLCGWLGLRRIWLSGTAGIAIGLLMMAMSSGSKSGWEDLISLINFFMMTGIGLAFGIVLELLAWIFGKRRPSP